LTCKNILFHFEKTKLEENDMILHRYEISIDTFLIWFEIMILAFLKIVCDLIVPFETTKRFDMILFFKKCKYLVHLFFPSSGFISGRAVYFGGMYGRWIEISKISFYWFFLMFGSWESRNDWWFFFEKSSFRVVASRTWGYELKFLLFHCRCI